MRIYGTCLKGLMSFKGNIPYNKPSLTIDYKYFLIDHFQIAMLVMSPPLFMSEEGHWVYGWYYVWGFEPSLSGNCVLMQS